MAVYGITTNTDTELSQLFAGDFQALKTVTVLSGEGACVRGEVMALDATDLKYVKLDLADTDQDEAECILVEACDSTSSDVLAGVLMSGEVHLADLVWPSGITAGQKVTAIQQLRLRGIIAK